MDNSRMSNDSASMYYSFNNTASQLDETLEANKLDALEDLSLSLLENLNSTLEGNEDKSQDHVLTVVRKPQFLTIPNNVLQEYRTFASTPTKITLESDLNKIKNPMNELVIEFLNTSQDPFHMIEENKENASVASSGISKIKEDVDTEIDMDFAKLEILPVAEEAETSDTCKSTLEVKEEAVVRFDETENHKNSGQVIKKRPSLKLRKSIVPSEPDLRNNKPSRIVNNRKSFAKPIKDFPRIGSGKLRPPKVTASTSAIPVQLSALGAKQTETNLISEISTEKPKFDMFSKPSIKTTTTGKTSLLNPKMLGRRQTIIANNQKQICSPGLKRRSIMPSAATGSGRRSIFPVNVRRSGLPKMLPTSTSTVNHPSTRIRKSVAPTNLNSVKPSPDELTQPRKLLVTETAKTCAMEKKLFSNNQCRFCDKKFAITKALTNHLFQNCTKIPPREKKKLLLPQRSPLPPIKSHTLTKVPSFNLGNVLTSSESICSINNGASVSSNHTATDQAMPPPSTKKVKKKMAMHSGIYRTPTKLIDCDKCKIKFNHILPYSEHCLTHLSDSSQSENSYETVVPQLQSSVKTTQTTVHEFISESTQTSPGAAKTNRQEKTKAVIKPLTRK